MKLWLSAEGQNPKMTSNLNACMTMYTTRVKTLSSEGNFRVLNEYLGRNTQLLKKNSPFLDAALAVLDPHQHSLGVLYILIAKFSFPQITIYETLCSQIKGFIANCNEQQVRQAPDVFAELCHSFTTSLVERHEPLRGIDVLTKAILKIQLFDSLLTSIHADLCQLCLLSKCMKPALRFLDIDITDINKEGHQFDAKYLLLYYYYGGMIYASLKNYERALYFFEVAVTTPCHAVSHIIVQAYKKHILVSLILYGKIRSLPAYTSPVVSRCIRHLSQPYHNLATAYAKNRPSTVRAVMYKHRDVYMQDHNSGLVKQCLSSMCKRNIKRLTEVFLTLSLSDMASRMKLSGPWEAEKYILNMIEDGEISASINHKDGMVIFHDRPEKDNSAAVIRCLEQEMAKCVALQQKFYQMDAELAANPKLLEKVQKFNAEQTSKEDFHPGGCVEN